MSWRRQTFPAVTGIFVLGGCEGLQSAFIPHGVEAARTLQLAWVMFTAAAFILLFVCAIMAVALIGPSRWRAEIARERLVVQLGVIFPAFVLTVLLLSGFVLMRAGDRSLEDVSQARIAVTGKQWWWQVTYTLPDGRTFEAANELIVPVGHAVELDLTSTDVIHSFWAPAYAGKVDMIPGRTNRLTLFATEAGVRRGQCAEYCGGAHALMSFYVVATTPENYAASLAHEASDAAIVSGVGLQSFLRSGCGACHAVRGTAARGRIGPDLTHVGGRESLGAGLLDTDAEGLRSWIVNHKTIKPGNKMPDFSFLTEEEVSSIANYLAELE